MLANGAKLAIKRNGDTEYINLKGLKEVPEFGATPEKIDVTALDDKVKMYDLGIADYGDVVFKFNYENSSENSSYRILREALKDNATVSFQYTLSDGSKFTFDSQGSLKLGAGAVNGVMEFTVTLSIQSEIEIVDPAV